jgi:nucleoside-diphosphate-sugar epimerase
MSLQERILIIGGLGFLGKNLYIALKDKNYEVCLLSNESLSEDDPFGAYLRPHDLIIGDIRDAAFMDSAVTGYSVIYSFAGLSGASESISNPYKDLEVNLHGHLNILEACRKNNPGVLLIFPSTRLVYGKPMTLPVSEIHRLVPESIYAIHKLTTEEYYLLYQRVHGINCIIYRISNPYGPFQKFGHKKYGILNWFIHQALHSTDIEIFGTGEQKRDYLFIDDLCELFVASIGRKKLYGKIYNIGYGEGIPIIEIIRIIRNHIPELKYTLVAWPEISKLIETGDYISDLSAIKKDLGWFPQTSFAEGLGKTIEFYRNNHA